MSQDPVIFDDPRLKAAIRRARGSHAARPELVSRVRERLAAAMAEEDASAQAPARDNLRIGPSRRWVIVRRLAIAALILLAFGAGIVFEQVRHEAVEREEYVAANQGLFREMIAAHTGADAAVANLRPLPTDQGP